MRRGDEFKCQDLNPREDTKTNRQTDRRAGQHPFFPPSLLTLRGCETQLCYTPQQEGRHRLFIGRPFRVHPHRLLTLFSAGVLAQRSGPGPPLLPYLCPRLLGGPVDGRLVAFLEGPRKKKGHKACNKCLSDILTEVWTHFIFLQLLLLPLLQGHSPLLRLEPLIFQLPAPLLQLLVPQLPSLLLLLHPLVLLRS